MVLEIIKETMNLDQLFPFLMTSQSHLSLSQHFGFTLSVLCVLVLPKYVRFLESFILCVECSVIVCTYYFLVMYLYMCIVLLLMVTVTV